MRFQLPAHGFQIILLVAHFVLFSIIHPLLVPQIVKF